MRLVLRPDSALAPLRAMPPTPRKRMRRALEALRDDPTGRSNGLDIKRLHVDGEPAVFRLRIGTWRAAFFVRRDTVHIVKVFARDEGYGWLDRLERRG